jgi:hypothetical protein
VIRRARATVVAHMLIVPVLAEAKPGPSKRAGDRVPSAQLQASGRGSMTIVGRMAVTGLIPGRGTVVVIDRGGDAQARLAGRPIKMSRKRATRVRNASGILLVTGSNVSVQVVGADLAFSIAGNGQARLRGAGVYRLNSGPERSWGRATIRVEPSASAARGGKRSPARVPQRR